MGVRSQASKDSKSVNYFWEFEAVCGPNSSEENKGRRVTNMVNGAGLEAGITQVCAGYIGMIAGLTGLSAEEIAEREIDETTLIGKKVWADVGERTVEGKVFKDFRAWSPANVLPF